MSSILNTCLKNCSSETNTYQNTSSSTNYSCKICSNAITNCLTCNNSTVCTSYGNSTYLKSDKFSCVVDCSNDIGIK